MIEQNVLEALYLQKGLSVKSVALRLRCSSNKVVYWMKKYNIPVRSISEAVYLKHNPNGDPFSFSAPQTIDDAVLFGLGIGLYWGEGNKSNKHAVRLGNTDPDLINIFIAFLAKFYSIKKSDLKFGLQLFTDINSRRAMNFWTKKLKVSRKQFYKITITQSGTIGTYKKKSEYGVVTVYYNNVKLRNMLVGMLPYKVNKK